MVRNKKNFCFKHLYKFRLKKIVITMTCNIRLSHVSVAMMNVLLRKKALKMSVCVLVSSGVCPFD